MGRRAAGSDPSYRHHKASGQAIVSLPRGDGTYRDYLLGPFNSVESRQEYARIIAEWKANGQRTEAYPDTTIAEMCLAFRDHVENYYRRPDGSPTNEVSNFLSAFRQLTNLYAHVEARNFDTLALQAVRQKMVEDDLCRKVVNSRINRIKHVFKWAVAQKMIPVEVYQALRTFSALSAGRSSARETEGVKPVPDPHVDAVLSILLPPTRAIVELLRLTGARPGEIVQMRRADIDMSGPIWIFRPRHHKNLWRGMDRVVAIGPKGQQILKEFFKPEIDAPLFSPRDAIRFHWERQRANRKSKVYPSQSRDRDNRLKQLNDSYSVAQVNLIPHYALVDRIEELLVSDSGDLSWCDFMSVPEIARKLGVTTDVVNGRLKQVPEPDRDGMRLKKNEDRHRGESDYYYRVKELLPRLGFQFKSD